VRALAANDRDLRPVNLLETQHVAAHPLTSLRLGATACSGPVATARCDSTPPR
jgi:hypothetical protein